MIPLLWAVGDSYYILIVLFWEMLLNYKHSGPSAKYNFEQHYAKNEEIYISFVFFFEFDENSFDKNWLLLLLWIKMKKFYLILFFSKISFETIRATNRTTKTKVLLTPTKRHNPITHGTLLFLFQVSVDFSQTSLQHWPWRSRKTTKKREKTVKKKKK